MMNMPSSSMAMPNSTMPMGSTMMMVFYTSTTTPLYSPSWMPSTPSQYAGTCIFLVMLATILRSLLALRAVQERARIVKECQRRLIVVKGQGQGYYTDMKPSSHDGSSQDGSSQNGSAELLACQSTQNANDLGSGTGSKSCVPPWRLSTDVPRALMDTVIVGVAYLLMLAVMTMNVGYFLSVLGGTFLGSACIGRYAPLFAH